MTYKDGHDGHWQIPVGDGEVFIYPPLNQWQEAITNNQRLNLHPEMIKTRIELRERVFKAALTYTSKTLGEPETAQRWAEFSPTETALLVTGHQPRFYHPGVWAKNFIVSRVANGSNAIPLNLIVDTDEVGNLGAALPVKKDSWSLEFPSLLETPSGTTFEGAEAPSTTIVNNFINQLEILSRDGYFPETRDALAGFIRILKKYGETKVSFNSLAAWLTRVRRSYEGEADYLELPVSELAEMPEFKDFAAMIISDAVGFNTQYNLTLHTYREKHGFRYKVNPFPDLVQDKAIGKYELPFWIQHQGTREPAFVVIDSTSSKLKLLAGEREVITLSKEVDSLELAGISLRPRGMTLTLFMRLYCCDLFLHGIGGAKYDGATDEFIKDYFALEPPIYAGGTMTIFPWLSAPEVTHEEVVKLEELLRDVEYNPDRHLDDVGLSTEDIQHLKNLAARKKVLIDQIKKPEADKKSLGGEIKRLNQQIGESLTGYRRILEEKLSSQKRLFAEREKVMRRDFPYFLFSPQLVSRVLDDN